MTTFTVETLAPTPAVALRTQAPLEQLPATFARAFRESMRVAAAQGVAVTGPPFGFYPRTPTDTVEVVAGFPVAAPVTADGDVTPFELPGGPVVTGIHTGPYDRLEDTYRELEAWAAHEGRTLAQGMWETYLSDPSSDPSAWETRINWPLAPASAPLATLIDLTGRTAIVTGGAVGIGLGIVRRLHEAGANVVVADLQGETAQSAASELGARGHAIEADISAPADIERLVAGSVERFGRIDILVNNAGIYPQAPFLDMPADLFERVLAVNLTGVFRLTQAVARRMIDQGSGGRVINVTSIDALHPSMVGLAHYDASKHGLWGFTKNIALELAPHGILVNAVAPGGILTPGVGAEDIPREALAAFEAAIPLRHLGDPDDIARTALFLASDLASYMTGTQIVVDGGRLLA
jgi:2-deoxy-D-gluconate 3-dehydrogenase